ncbi:MAG: O-antigen ligase family protein [Rhodospirillaceae bacterium]|nr:O-antigen ligase family protein [Rhodospirillaceae bacterium]
MPRLSKAFVVLLTLVPLVATFAAMGITPALILLVLLVGFAAGWQRPRNGSGDPTLLIALVAVLAWSLLSIWWSITPGFSFESGAKLVGIMLIGFGGVQMARMSDELPRNAIIAFAAALGVCACALALENLTGLLRAIYAVLHLDFSRFIDKNVNRGLCALVVLLWPAVNGLYRFGAARAGRLLAAVVAIAVVGMDSLSATLALVASGAVYGLIMKWPTRVPHMLALAIPIFFMSWPLIFALLDKPVFADPDIYNALPPTAQHRVEIWRFALGKAFTEPWVGWGFETARGIPGGDVVYQGERKYMPLHPHNSAIQILLELGVVGLVLWTAGIALVLRRWRKAAMPVYHRATSGAAITAYLSIGFTAFGAWQTWWIALGWLVAMLWLMIAREPAT